MMDDLFGRPVVEVDPIADYDFLYFCVNVSDKNVSAEISRPSGLTGGFVASYSKRVILCQPGENPRLRRPQDIPVDFAEIDKPIINRKA